MIKFTIFDWLARLVSGFGGVKIKNKWSTPQTNSFTVQFARNFTSHQFIQPTLLFVSVMFCFFARINYRASHSKKGFSKKNINCNELFSFFSFLQSCYSHGVRMNLKCKLIEIYNIYTDRLLEIPDRDSDRLNKNAKQLFTSTVTL